MKGPAALVAAACIAGCVQGFVAPSAFNGAQLTRTAAATSKAAVSMEFAGGLIGADGPEPTSYHFDPLGLAEKAPENVLFYREAEIKHGRIAMLAVVGLVVAQFVRLPGDIYQGVSVVEAHNAMVEKGPMVQLLFWISFFEILCIPLVVNMQGKDREPGDFALDPMGFCKDADKKKRYQIAELKNGRLAMLASGGILTQTVLSGHGFPYI